MKVKTNELTGKALDYAVAMAQGYSIITDGINHAIISPDKLTKIIGQAFTAETIALDLITQYDLSLIRANEKWFCQGDRSYIGHPITTGIEGEFFDPCFMIDESDGIYGNTPAQAIGRMIVLMLLGNTVELPNDLF